MRTRSAVEIARASLALAFPTATEEGLDRAAQLVVRWGSQGVGDQLTGPLRELLLEDLEIITQSTQPLARVEEPRTRRAAPHERVWRTTEATRRRPPDPGGAATPV